jgi:hypothetical protein
MRRALLRLVVAVVVIAAATFAFPARADGPGTFTNPVNGRDFPDPFVLRVDGAYYAYGTNQFLPNVQILRSTDLVSWEWIGDALPGLPVWAERGFTWAPSVLQRGAQFVLYYTALERSSRLQCVSRAVGVSPLGPFVDTSTEPLICQRDLGGTIDPSPFVDNDGTPWLLFKSEGKGSEPARLWSQRLTADGLFLTGQASALLHPQEPWEGRVVENPAMLAHHGQYHLVYSANRWDTGAYAVGTALCASPAGPCSRQRRGPVLASRGNAAGPGGLDVFIDNRGFLWGAYHAWSSDLVGYPRGSRSFRLDRIGFLFDHLGVDGPTTRPTPVHGWHDDPVVGVASTPSVRGYWLGASDGAVFAFGDSTYVGSARPLRLAAPVVSVAPTPTGRGYWMAGADGGVFAFGDAVFAGSAGGAHLAQPVTGMASSPSGRGYWLVAGDGGVFAFGDAGFHGAAAGLPLGAPIVGITPTPSGRGYWLVGADGGVFAFGDAGFHGSVAGDHLNSPVVGIAASRSGRGYWVVAADGGVFSFGDARFHGSAASVRLRAPVVGMAASQTGSGYWLVSRDGGVFSYGDAAFAGSAANRGGF